MALDGESSSRYRDPLWRVAFDLTPLEEELLRSWWVRRLAFVAHAGAGSLVSHQTYSRLEHSLGLLALVVHFRPDDHEARAAALLHDVGHLPFSHTFEGVAGLDHHELGAARIRALAPILERHGLNAAVVVETVDGVRPSIVHGSSDGLGLDHLESFVRSGRAHGRTREPPPDTLARLRVVAGAVDTDADEAAYLTELIAGEARWQTSEQNLVATAVLRHLAGRLIDAPEARREAIATMTDHDFWAALLADPRTADAAETLRRDPETWRLINPDDEPTGSEADDIGITVSRLYLGLPSVDGQPLRRPPPQFEGLPSLPRLYRVRRRA